MLATSELVEYVKTLEPLRLACTRWAHARLRLPSAAVAFPDACALAAAAASGAILLSWAAMTQALASLKEQVLNERDDASVQQLELLDPDMLYSAAFLSPAQEERLCHCAGRAGGIACRAQWQCTAAQAHARPVSWGWDGI